MNTAAAHRATAEDRLATWWSRRIYNDREADHGVLMVVLAVWVGVWHQALGATAWWAEVFQALPVAAWVALLGGLGACRVVLAIGHHDGRRLAMTALASCFVFSFLGFLVAIVRWQMSVTPLFFWLAYQAAKSHVRLMVAQRRAEA